MISNPSNLPGTDPAADFILPPLASLARRLAAILYDSLLLIGVLFIAVALVLGLAVAIQGSDSVQLHSPLRGHPLFSMYLLLVCFFFYAGFWRHGGQTLGMRAWRLQIQRADGQTVSWRQALVRFLVSGLWLAPVIYLHQLFNITALSLSAGLATLVLIQALRLPDRLSATTLVVLPKRSAVSAPSTQRDEADRQK